MSLRSIDYLFDYEETPPDRLYLSPTGHAAVALDEYPANARHHLIVAINTPNAARRGIRQPWHSLPASVRSAAHSLVDLVQRHLYSLQPAPELVSRIEAESEVIEPHMHLLSDGDPTSLWRKSRIGDETVRLSVVRMREIVADIGFSAVAEEADHLMMYAYWSDLGKPRHAW